jgi:tRNA-2-methylthio-N6-dimethylallyladenosine synthase
MIPGMELSVYLETMGCQMNKLDSELVQSRLTDQGYRFVEDPSRAGIIIFNTCSVRQHAEDKLISKIGQLKRRCKDDPKMVLAVVGCMAERLGEQLLKDHPHVDIVCGPDQLGRLGPMIDQARRNHGQAASLNEAAETEPLEEFDLSRRQIESERPFMAYVRAARGCNKYCSYCVVPYVRGRERSRPIRHIVEESRRLVDRGVIEITLLGQTINSYTYRDGDKNYDLADVLEQVHEIPGLRRLRFVTSYPQDFPDRILHAMADLPKVCEYLHIPAQSGSDRILRAMNRHYTAAEYLALIERAREIVPGVTFSGDFIVGYCGESDEDFSATCDLVRKVEYKNCFIFKYSPRPGTRAESKMADDVPEAAKQRRNVELLKLQNEIARAINQRLVGTTVEILVEGPSKKPHLNHRDGRDFQSGDSVQLVGRTRGDHIVVFDGPGGLIGQITAVRIERASSLTLFGRL